MNRKWLFTEEALPRPWRDVPAPRKRDYGGRLNLSSNELHHEEIDAIFREFIAEWRVERIRKYPYYPAAEKEIAAAIRISPRNLSLQPGSDAAIRTITAVLRGSGTPLLLHSPIYENYRTYAIAAELPAHAISFAGRSAAEQVGDLKEAIDAHPGAVVAIANPNGITGGALTLPQVKALCDHARRRDSLVVVDEAYASFADLDHSPLMPACDNLVILRSFSKTLGLAGLRVAAVLGPHTLVDALRRLRGQNDISALALDFAIHCIHASDRFLKITEDIRAWRGRFAATLRVQHPGWSVPASAANFLLVDVGSPVRAAQIVEHLERRGTVVKGCDAFPGFQSAFRVTIAPPPLMDRLLEALRDVA